MRIGPLILFLFFQTFAVAGMAKGILKCFSVFNADSIYSDQVGQGVKDAWQELLYLGATAAPENLNPELVLQLTEKLSIELANELANLGYTTSRRIEARKVYANYGGLVKPARWIVKIELDDADLEVENLRLANPQAFRGRQKKIIQNSIQKHETEIYFDFFGLWLSSSSGVTDFDGKTHLGFNKELFEVLNEEFVTLLLHEIHHAFNHKRLKKGGENGLNAEVNIFPESKKSFRVPGYSKHFHFDEIIANYRQYKQIKGRIRLLKRTGRLAEKLEKSLQAEARNHLELLLEFTRHARVLTRLAIETVKSEKGSKLWNDKIIWYLKDPEHGVYSANIPLFLSDLPELQQFKFTIWLPKAHNNERSEESKQGILDELNRLYESVLYYRHQALKEKREEL